MDASPNRWLHLRRDDGFTEELFDVFCAGSEVFVAHAIALLRVWRRLPWNRSHPEIEYAFFPPELSPDRKVATLPIGGPSTVGTRAAIENGLSYLLWQHIPAKFMAGVAEGLTETLDSSSGSQTSWRAPATGITFSNTDPELRKFLAT